MQVQVAICKLQVAFYELQLLGNNFTICKFCFMSWEFKILILRVASCFLWVESLRW